MRAVKAFIERADTRRFIFFNVVKIFTAKNDVKEALQVTTSSVDEGPSECFLSTKVKSFILKVS